MKQASIGDGENTKQLFEHVHSNVAKYLLSQASFAKDQIEEGSPLFEGKFDCFE